MKNRLLDFIIKNIKNNYNYDNTKLKEIRYGLETLVLTIFKLLIIFLISIFIHTTRYLCLFFLTYGLLRIVGFGLHTKNSIQCWIMSILTFTLIPIFIKYINISKIYLCIFSFILLFLIVKYAPADTEKRPLINFKKRRIFKLFTTIISIIYLIIIILSKNYIIRNLFFSSILLEVLLIIPISYKLLGLKYNNYLLYKKKGGKNENIS